MNNRLLAVLLPEDAVRSLMAEADASSVPLVLAIDVEAMTVASPARAFRFTMSERHRTMFLKGIDMIGASLEHVDAIEVFARAHWSREPWVQDVAQRTKERLDRRSAG